MLTRRTQSRLDALRGLVWAPLADLLAGCQRLLVVPHGELCGLPFAALWAGQPGPALALVGEQASLAALRQHAAQADVLHLACHARFRVDNPRFSALHLHDAALTTDIAEALALPAATVVLSACETGVSELGAGQEMVGLLRAFLLAGAARVVASLWPVGDADTARFMAHIHRALAAGQGPAAALAAAQQSTRPELPHPHFWAAFTLHGGW